MRVVRIGTQPIGLVCALGVFLLCVCLPAFESRAADVPQTFTLDGKFYGNAQGTTALVDSSIGVKVQILDEDRVCVLYEEQQSVSTAASNGYFSIQVGSAVGDPKRAAGDSGNTMPLVFQNTSSVTGKKVLDGTACAVAPVGGKRRYVRISITPSSLGGAPRILSPDLNIDSVPNAVVAERAETLQGYRSTELLKVNTATGNVLSQANLENLFASTTRFNALTAVVDGTSNSYVRSGTSGAQLPVITGAPTAPSQGALWYDTSDNKLKFRTGVGTTEILNSGTPDYSSLVANGGGTPSIQTGLDAGRGAASTNGRLYVAYDTKKIYRDNGATWDLIGASAFSDLSGAASLAQGGTGLTAAGTANQVIGMNAGATAAEFKTLTAGANVTITHGAGSVTIAAAGGVPSGAAGGDLTGTYPNPGVGQIQGTAISAVAPTAGQVLRLSSSVWTPVNFGAGDLLTAAGAAQFASASCSTSQTLTWSSLTNTFTCSNIAGLDAGTITTGTISASRLPAGVGAWTASGSDIYFSGGKVGIGTSTPVKTLDVAGTLNATGVATIQAATIDADTA